MQAGELPVEMAGDNGEAPGSDEEEEEALLRPEAKRSRPPKGRQPKQQQAQQEARADPIKINAGLTVLSLGRVEWVHPAFHASRHILPVGFSALRLAATPASGGKEAPHTCEILAAPDGSGPLFRWVFWRPGFLLFALHIMHCFLVM